MYLITAKNQVGLDPYTKICDISLTYFPRLLRFTVQAQIKLREVIADYLEKIDLAGKAISDTVRKKISQDDVILTFG